MTNHVPPYRHLPTSISTSGTVDPTATTTTESTPRVGSTGTYNGRSYVKNLYGWVEVETGVYANLRTALYLDGWREVDFTSTSDLRPGDIAMNSHWYTPPRAH